MGIMGIGGGGSPRHSIAVSTSAGRTPCTKTQAPQRQERGVDFSTTVECEMELHQAHSVAMLRRASRRNIDIRGAVSKY